MTPMSERIQRALAFAVAEMPTGRNQQMIGEVVEQMRQANENENYIVRVCVSAVLDGLLYGNWPAVLDSRMSEITRKKD